jgi:pyruvate formate lyase activating enzyme
MTSGIIFDIKRYAINDGPGIRTAVFFKGCPLKCWWCHNPEGQSIKPQLMVRANRCKSSQACLAACPLGAITWKDGPETDWELCDHCGKCVDACYAGAREIVRREINVDQLMVEVGRDVPFYDQSKGGVTFTGGEPLLQMDFLREALLACRNQHIHTAVDTSGYTSWKNLSSITPLVDLFLYDLKLMNPTKHQEYTSVSNKRILDNLIKLSSEAKSITVRIPIIPGVNDDEVNIHQCGSYLASLAHLGGVEVMPYHAIGVAKYRSLGKQYKLENTQPPTQLQICKIEKLLSRYGLPLVRHPSGRIL